MIVYLVDGTYELFRHYFAVPKSSDSRGREIAAVRGVLGSILGMIEGGAKYIGVATDHVIESFRNDLYHGYKTGDGLPEDLVSQFPLLEEGLAAMGVMVWPMIEFEADDALAAAAEKAEKGPRVKQVIICTPDKDLAQCVRGQRIIQMDRMRNTTRDESGVFEKFGVKPKSIPDYLALVGDTADGYPGIQGWGPKAAATLLSKYETFERVPKNASEWDIPLRGAAKLAATLFDKWDDVLLFRDLARLRTDVPVFDTIDQLAWITSSPAFEQFCADINAAALAKRASRAMAK